MTQPSNVRFVMEDRLQSDLAALQATLDADQTAFEGQINAKIAGVSGQNYLINGAMDVWQRGVGPFTATGYCADRWKIDARTAMTVGQYTQPTDYFTMANYTDSKYALEIYSTNATNSIQISQYFESSYVNALRGQSVVLSFSMQCRDSTAPTVYAAIGTSDTADSSTAAFSMIASVANNAPSSWQRFEVQAEIPYDLTNLGLCVRFNIDNIALDEHIQITNVKLERGTAATPFTRAGGDLAGERIACQRYYQRLNANTAVTILGNGGSSTTTNDVFLFPLRTTMRIPPTVVDYPTPTTTYFYGLNWAGAGGSTVTAISLNNASLDTVAINCTVTGAVAGAAALFRTITTAAYIGFSAEL